MAESQPVNWNTELSDRLSAHADLAHYLISLETIYPGIRGQTDPLVDYHLGRIQELLISGVADE